MKKLLCLTFSLLLFSIPFYVAFGEMVITLSHGWNVVSTPAILSSIEFSNSGEGISFSKLSDGQWVSVPATVGNIKPLEGFMVYNGNSENVNMTLNYKTDANPTESLLQKNLNNGWNFLGIVSLSSTFNTLTGATMSVDFTNNGSTNNLNKVNNGYVWNSNSSNIDNPELGEAYGVFINQGDVIYGGVNNGGAEVINCNSCNLDLSTCPIECKNVNIEVDVKDMLLVKSENASLGKFTISPSSNGGANLYNIFLSGTIWTGDSIEYITPDDIKFIINNVEYLGSITTSGILYEINKNIPSAGYTGEIILKNEYSSGANVEIIQINGLDQNKKLKKGFVEALAYIKSQQNEDSFTQYRLGVDLYSMSYVVKNVQLFTDEVCQSGLSIDGLNLAVDDNDDFTINNESSAQTIRCISYEVWSGGTEKIATYHFNNVEYPDFFKTEDGAVWRVFANK